MKLIIALICIGFILNLISSHYVHKNAMELLKEPYVPLPDIVHRNLPKINLCVPDFFLVFCIFVAIFYYSSLVNVNKNLLCIGICLIIRSVSMFFTIMPTCVPESNNSDKSFYEKCFHTDHDLMFSGHTLFFIAIGNMLNNIFIKLIITII